MIKRCLIVALAILGGISQAVPSGLITQSGPKLLLASGGGGTGRTWAERSTAAGVTNALSFTSGLEGCYVNSDNGVRGFHDTTEKVETGGSLRFEVRAGETGANVAGACTKSSSPWMFGSGAHYSEGETFYIQYRAKLSQSMLDNVTAEKWTAGGNPTHWKLFILHQNNASCANIEMTLKNPVFNGTMYTACGNDIVQTTTTGPTHNNSPPTLWQQKWDLLGGSGKEASGVESAYPAVNWFPPGNQWFTIYVKVHVGTLTGDGSVSDSTVEMWTQEGGVDAWFKVIGAQHPLKFDTNDSDGFNNITITPYMSGMDASTTSATSFYWVTEFIASSQPIARPVLP